MSKSSNKLTMDPVSGIKLISEIPQGSVIFVSNTVRGQKLFMIPPSRLSASLKAELDRRDAEFYEED